jgi:hypothetical protein
VGYSYHEHKVNVHEKMFILMYISALTPSVCVAHEE